LVRALGVAAPAFFVSGLLAMFLAAFMLPGTAGFLPEEVFLAALVSVVGTATAL
jgi:hypothetical protein